MNAPWALTIVTKEDTVSEDIMSQYAALWLAEGVSILWEALAAYAMQDSGWLGASAEVINILWLLFCFLWSFISNVPQHFGPVLIAWLCQIYFSLPKLELILLHTPIHSVFKYVGNKIWQSR